MHVPENRLTVRVPPDLRAALEAEAQAKRTTISRLMRSALRAAVASRPAPATAARA